MAEINLKVPVKITIKDGDKSEDIEVTIRELTKKEAKDIKEKVEKFKDISYKIERLQSKLESAKKKAEYAEKLEDYKKAMQMQERAEEIEDELDSLLQEFKKLGGEEFFEKKSKETFKKCVDGPGKAKLEEIAEIKGYSFIMQELGKAKEESLEGK